MALITIRPAGFDPVEVTPPSSRFLLAVDNKSGLERLTLRLTTVKGDWVRDIQLSPQQPKWREKITLAAGNYLMTEANHPNWRCRLTIAP